MRFKKTNIHIRTEPQTKPFHRKTVILESKIGIFQNRVSLHIPRRDTPGIIINQLYAISISTNRLKRIVKK